MIRSCGIGAVLAGTLFAAWGYLDGGLAPSAYLNAALPALAFAVPALFLVGLAGLYTKCTGTVSWLGGMGFVLGFIGSAAGSLQGFKHLIGWYSTHVLGSTSAMARGLLVISWIDWLPVLLTGLSLIGIAAARTKTLGALHTLPLAMGAFGWAYLFTDSGGAVETRLGHVAFGILFSLSWMALGSMLWYQGGAAYNRTLRS